MIMKKNNLKTGSSMAAFSVLLFVCTTSCDDFLRIDAPKSQLVTASVFANDAFADGTAAGIYFELFTNTSFADGGNRSITSLLGVATDELVYMGNVAGPQTFSANGVIPTTQANADMWVSVYKMIYRANDLIEGLEASAGVSAMKADQLRGEALFLRAFGHFCLVNLYGPVPLALTADYRVTGSLPREAEDVIYNQVEKDLLDAKQLLPRDYTFTAGERVRPVSWAAAALLARVYLYRQRWQEAADMAGEVIQQGALYSLAEPVNVFLKNNPEAIWQLLTFHPGVDTYNGFYAIPLATSAVPPAYVLSPGLLAAFEDNDQRRVHWVARFTPRNSSTMYNHPFKFKVKQVASGVEHKEYSVILRLAELYLIRAEARAMLGDLSGAKQDVDLIRARHGGLPPVVATGKEGLLKAIEQERFVEFFHEWGHRWFDLKRWGTADAVLGPLKPDWQPWHKLLPIPQSELNANPFLTQNPGYE